MASLLAPRLRSAPGLGVPYAPLGPSSASQAFTPAPVAPSPVNTRPGQTGHQKAPPSFSAYPAPRMSGPGMVGTPSAPTYRPDLGNPMPGMPFTPSPLRTPATTQPSSPIPSSPFAPAAGPNMFKNDKGQDLYWDDQGTHWGPSAPGFSGTDFTPAPFVGNPNAPATQPTVPGLTYPGMAIAPTPTRTTRAAATPSFVPPIVSEQQVSTDPKQNFQRSLNLERATTADRAATFAEGSPLPMDENGQYNGAFGRGPDAHRRALAARQGFVNAQRKTSAAQNFGLGQASDEAQQLRQDANARENADSADANGMTAKDFAAVGRGLKDAASANRINQLAPGQLDQQRAQLQYLKDRSADLRRRGEYNPDLKSMTLANAHDITTAAMAAHRELVTQINGARRALANPALDPSVADGIQTHLNGLVEEEKRARVNVDAAVKRASDMRNGVARRGGPTTQPTATTQPAGNGQSLTHEDAATILQEAGGDKNRARQIAQSRGYSF